MRTFIKFVILAVIGSVGFGCQTASSTTQGKSEVHSQSDSATVDRKEFKTEEPKVSAPVVSLATPTEAYKTAYELRKKCDIAGLKQVMSNEVLEFMSMMGEDQKKSLDAMLREICDKPQADRAEVRNEKIKGDKAQVQYLTETGGWKIMDFEKVGEKWLLSLPSADDMNGLEPER